MRIEEIRTIESLKHLQTPDLGSSKEMTFSPNDSLKHLWMCYESPKTILSTQAENPDSPAKSFTYIDWRSAGGVSSLLASAPVEAGSEPTNSSAENKRACRDSTEGEPGVVIGGITNSVLVSSRRLSRERPGAGSRNGWRRRLE